MSQPKPAHADPAPLIPRLNLADSTLLIMGGMIGSGIFIVSADIARLVQSPGLLLLVWALTAVITVFGALTYGELAAMMPKAGGQYVYLKEAFGPLTGFLYGWTLFAVIQTGTIAAVAVAFARFAGVFFPGITTSNKVLQLGWFSISTEQVVAIAVIISLTAFNFRSVKTGALLNNVLTISKVGSLLLLIALGFSAGWINPNLGDWSHFTPTWPDVWTIALFGTLSAAMVGSLFSADAWNNITFTAGEVMNPKRNLPLSLALGTGSVTLIYLIANVAYLYVLPIQQIGAAPSDRVGTLLMETVIGPWGLYLMAIMVMISTFGCVNAATLAGGRVYYTMANDGVFFSQAGKLNRNGVPANALAFQGAWTVLLTLSGSYNDLLTYVIFAVLLFYILTAASVFVFRRTRPDAERPYRAYGYPWIPAVYIVLSVIICVNLVLEPASRSQSLWGLLIVLLGVPLYYVAVRLRGPQAPS
jgi:APA family basic amino acid/polyamine antiporter